MQAVLGVSDHIGWAELVTVGADRGVPLVLDRRRVELIDAGVPSAPYHHESLTLPLAEAERLVERTRRSVAGHCRRVLSDLASGFGLAAVVVPASPIERLPDSLAEVLATYRITCAADGMLYRELLAASAAQLGLDVVRTPRKADRVAVAAHALGVPVPRLAMLLAGLGRRVGRPWTREHRDAAAAALAVLAGRTGLRVT